MKLHKRIGSWNSRSNRSSIDLNDVTVIETIPETGQLLSQSLLAEDIYDIELSIDTVKGKKKDRKVFQTHPLLEIQEAREINGTVRDNNANQEIATPSKTRIGSPWGKKKETCEEQDKTVDLSNPAQNVNQGNTVPSQKKLNSCWIKQRQNESESSRDSITNVENQENMGDQKNIRNSKTNTLLNFASNAKKVPMHRKATGSWGKKGKKGKIIVDEQEDKLENTATVGGTDGTWTKNKRNVALPYALNSNSRKLNHGSPSCRPSNVDTDVINFIIAIDQIDGIRCLNLAGQGTSNADVPVIIISYFKKFLPTGENVKYNIASFPIVKCNSSIGRKEKYVAKFENDFCNMTTLSVEMVKNKFSKSGYDTRELTLQIGLMKGGELINLGAASLSLQGDERAASKQIPVGEVMSITKKTGNKKYVCKRSKTITTGLTPTSFPGDPHREYTVNKSFLRFSYIQAESHASEEIQPSLITLGISESVSNLSEHFVAARTTNCDDSTFKVIHHRSDSLCSVDTTKLEDRVATPKVSHIESTMGRAVNYQEQQEEQQLHQLSDALAELLSLQTASTSETIGRAVEHSSSCDESTIARVVNHMDTGFEELGINRVLSGETDDSLDDDGNSTDTSHDSNTTNSCSDTSSANSSEDGSETSSTTTATAFRGNSFFNFGLSSFDETATNGGTTLGSFDETATNGGTTLGSFDNTAGTDDSDDDSSTQSLGLYERITTGVNKAMQDIF